jgi:hypothetical protein
LRTSEVRQGEGRLSKKAGFDLLPMYVLLRIMTDDRIGLATGLETSPSGGGRILKTE